MALRTQTTRVRCSGSWLHFSRNIMCVIISNDSGMKKTSMWRSLYERKTRKLTVVSVEGEPMGGTASKTSVQGIARGDEDR